MLVPLLALAMFAQQGDAGLSPQYRGSALYDQCRAFVRILDDTSMASSDIRLAGLCAGYLEGFTDSQLLSSDALTCVPPDATTGTIARIYVLYMQKNPKELDRPRYVGLIVALVDSYPCPTKPKQ